MYTVKNYYDNKNIVTVAEKGAFRVMEYVKDLSVSPDSAMQAYYMSSMNVRRRQVICDLSRASVKLQAGAMQWMLGDVSMVSGVKGLGGLLGNAFKGMATGESAAKPEYEGTGVVALEPTYKHILLEDVSEWNGGMTVTDGMFLACEKGVNLSVVSRTNVSSAVAGGQGIFNLNMSGQGVVCLESAYPRGELMEITLEKDTIKIDGNMALCWSNSLEFTVERSSKTLTGSAVSGEGLVNVYRGTGKILMIPVM